VQSEILEPHPEAELAVYAVWFNMLPADDYSEWDDSLLTDDRVIHFWDQPKEVGRWYAQQDVYPVGPVAYDIYFLYGPEAEWEEIPKPLLSLGSTILGQKTRLSEVIAPLLNP